jgi:dTDP-glucose 4,6-dehydratase
MAEFDIEKFARRIVVTGGAGFIGSNFLLYMIPKYPDYLFINVDCLTYAGNLSNLAGIEGAPNYRFERINICDFPLLQKCFDKYRIDGVIHLAAETHVDRSIIGPAAFIQTNVMGTFNLLELARKQSAASPHFRFCHISTDEVYGSLGDTGNFREDSPYRPNSPYSASKASGDHLVRAYHKTYGLDTITTNCSNNYGPYQFPEKFIPLIIRNARDGRTIPIYGDGQNIRDWLYVEDHCRAIDLVFHKGESGATYNIGGRAEIKNIELATKVCRILDEFLGGPPREKLIAFVKDRPGHDRRYAMDDALISKKLGWRPAYSFEDSLRRTVRWYLDNDGWVQNCINGEYLRYYDLNYSRR